MAQTSITLTASMRSNLSSLRSIQGQMDKTQERLSTGKKVNSAIDNASSYYQARSLTNRAADLDSLLDSMGQGIQTIQAANEGIEAITSYVDQLKSVATSALALDPAAKNYGTELQAYQDQYNAILKEIDTLAKDSSYQGVNLLKGNKLTVMFNETRTHKLDVQGDDVTAQMTVKGAEGFTWTVNANNETVGNVSWVKNDVEPTYHAQGATTMTKATVDADSFDAGTYYTYDADDGFAVADSFATGTTYYKAGEKTTTYVTTEASDSIAADSNSGVMYDEMEAEAKYVDNKGTLPTAANAQADINKTLDAIANVTTYLRSYATELGNNFTIIETRQDFTEALVDVLETGSDNLVLADMNEESANYLALQTRQQLAINSLSLASQSAQSVLSLF